MRATGKASVAKAHAASGAAVPSGPMQAIDLSLEDWGVLFATNALTRGTVYTDGIPGPAPKMAFQFKPVLPNFQVHDATSMTNTVANSAASAQAVASGYDQSNAGVSLGFLGGDTTTSTSSTKTTSSSSSTSAQNITEFIFPRVILFPSSSVELTPAFKKELEDGLAEPTPLQQAFRLQAILGTYGATYPNTVQLGGKLYQISKASTEALSSSSETSTTVTKKKKALFYSSTSSSTSTTATSNSSNNSKSMSSWRATGGDPLLSSSTSDWQKSVADWTTWRVLKYGKQLPLVSLLPSNMQQKIKELAKTPEYKRVFLDKGTASTLIGKTVEISAPVQSKNSGTINVTLLRRKPGEVIFSPAVPDDTSNPDQKVDAGNGLEVGIQSVKWKLGGTGDAVTVTTTTSPYEVLTATKTGGVTVTPASSSNRLQRWMLLDASPPDFVLLNRETGQALTVGASSPTGYGYYDPKTISFDVSNPEPGTNLTLQDGSGTVLR